MENKVWYKSKELIVLIAGLLNTVLNSFGLPSFDLTPEFIGALLLVVATFRTFSTKTKIKFSK